MKFTVHTIVKNEDLWVWFAIQSILPYADQILIYDTGSTDHTVEIIKSIKSSKIIFEEKGPVDRRGMVRLRQEQLDKTKTPWFLILDGDEVWPRKELEATIKEAEDSDKLTKALISQTRNCIGDVYHYLDSSSGGYQIGEVRGHLNMRLIRKTEDLKVVGEFPLESYIDSKGVLQDQVDCLIFSRHWYLHANFLRRSSSDKNKKSGSLGKSKIWEKGLVLGGDGVPEVFALNRPRLVADPLKKRSVFFEAGSVITTPILKIKRKIR